MKIVFLDRKSVGEDIDLQEFQEFGQVVTYDYSTKEEMIERVEDADVLILNKMLVNEETIGGAKNLKLVCVTATGTNNLDKEYLDSRGIAWRNVAGYSTETVAQHTFAMLFYLLENLPYYDDYVKSGSYVNDRMFTHFEKHFTEVKGKTWGIIGLGTIGRRVAELAKAFGCRVIYYSTSGQNHNGDYEEVSFEDLLRQSDFVTIHAPLNEKTYHLMGWEAFEQMKETAILINVGRGPIVVEEDLARALDQGQIAAAGLDVLDVEPMAEENPLRKVKDQNRLLITPHIGWAATEARQRLMHMIAKKIRKFFFES
ncbi:MAG: D-2-hydroxyacid dehydrogenase [Eubacterium sp.]|nr:D-2-hydroxyacid dehydrogenase [Eubacterium sp.]